MEDIPEWERLSDALQRVMASGASEREAQIAICRGISNRRIRFHVFIGNLEGSDVFLEQGWEREVPPSVPLEAFAFRQAMFTQTPPLRPTLTIPSGLEPEDFNWQDSRPLKPWRDLKAAPSFFDWHNDRIELFSAGATRILIPTGATQSPERTNQAEQKDQSTRERAQPTRARALRTLFTVDRS